MNITTIWVYVRIAPGLWTVGFFDPDGKFETDSDHSDREAAAGRVAYLNGNADLNELRGAHNDLSDLVDLIHTQLRTHIATMYAHDP